MTTKEEADKRRKEKSNNGNSAGIGVLCYGLIMLIFINLNIMSLK